MQTSEEMISHLERIRALLLDEGLNDRQLLLRLRDVSDVLLKKWISELKHKEKYGTPIS